MTPEDYLRQYAEPLRPLAEATPGDWQSLLLEPDYYYPPSMDLGVGLDGLNRSDLLALLQQILKLEYPQQRLSKSTARTFLETLRRSVDERERLQAELARLTAVLDERQADNERMNAALTAQQAELQRLAVELERSRSEAAISANDTATLRANLTDLQGSSSWKVTKPLRWFGRLGRVMRAPDLP
ncbi:MAG: hypothetical protein IPP10_04050 [Candidatus Competibacteraceae bacterium]|nr:hypothetical protein [Candidatus Competibacteraceae bacterium]MBK7983781.1 hypothetical protein [Candidatus Competibacteraceae bacterium]MBK8897678.1 hypothetical protein [Candidatus Competibacteraceae bacterium]MBK9950712.1 hypothetical protein [Candidatus Competibacteraceae bacterium]